jgi:uroporphyrinogen decarboxylase
MKPWKEEVLTSNKRFAVPLMIHPGIELIGAKISNAISDGEVHFKAMKAIQEYFHPDVSVSNIMMDLTVEAEAFGAIINISENESPAVASRCVCDEDSIKALNIPSLYTGRIPQYLKSTELAVKNIIGKPIFAGCIGPFSLAGRLFDLSEIMTAILIEPDSIHILLEKCSAFILEYAKEFKKLGANGIIMAEPAAGLLSPDMCDEFSSKYIKKMVFELQDNNFLFILHNCGNTGHVTQSMVSTGAGALHFGNKIDLPTALLEVPEDILVMGNLDPVGVFRMASPESVYQTTFELLQKTANHKNFIISSGCDIPPGVPMENIEAFFAAVQSFNSENC